MIVGDIFNEDRGDDIARAFERRSETRDANVLAVEGTTYTLEDVVTGGVYEADSLVNTTIAVGKRVTVRHDATGRSTGQRPQIIGAASDSRNGQIIGGLQYEVSLAIGTIAKLPPYPIRLVKGGLPVAVTIYGERLSGAATYGTADVTDAVAQRVTDSALIIQVQATGACAPGLYSLAFVGVTISKFFEVTAS